MSIEVMTVSDLLWSDNPITYKDDWFTYINQNSNKLSRIYNVRSIPYVDDNVEVQFDEYRFTDLDQNYWFTVSSDLTFYRDLTPTICGEDWCENYTPMTERGLEVARLVAASIVNGQILRNFGLIYDTNKDKWVENKA